MRVRIRQVPIENEVDGVQLDSLRPGVVREFSAIVGSWLIAKGYADAEMRSPERQSAANSSDRPSIGRRSTNADQRPDSANDSPRPRRRHDDR
jgi:hypothetical protein